MVISKSKKRLRTFALLDTGAGVTIFGTQHAEDLGIDWRDCPDIDVIGHPGIDTAKGAYPILGHNGFFENFEVRFKNRRFTIRLV